MLLFDLDGTLIDSNGIWVDVDLHFLSRYGLELTEEYAYTVGHSIFPVAAAFTRDYYRMDRTAEEIMAEWLSLAGDAYAHVALKPGAREFLARCAGRGERMALVTACVPALCRTALEVHDLEGYFEDLVFVQELGVEKRDPAAFRMTLDRLGAAAAECVLFEDSPGACAAAQSVGIQAVGVYDEFYAKFQDGMREKCDRYILSFTELLSEKDGSPRQAF